MARVKATTAHTVPAGSEMAAGEVTEFIYDAVNDLGAGQAPTNATATLLTRDQEVVVGGATMDTPPIVATQIFVRVAGIERRQVYELRIGFDHTNPRVEGEHTIKIHVIEGI